MKKTVLFLLFQTVIFSYTQIYNFLPCKIEIENHNVMSNSPNDPNSAIITHKTQKTFSSYADTKIPIQGSRWYQLNNVNKSIEGLFNNLTGDIVHTGYGKVLDNYDAYYPLLDGEKITIQRIRFFDGEGSFPDQPMTLSVITNDWRRVPIATFTGQQYNGWVGPYPNRPTHFDLDSAITNARYLVINAWWGYPTEIELYGSYSPPASSLSGSYRPRNVQLKDMLGVNAFEWDFEDGQNNAVNESKLKAMKTFSGFRHYIDWEKLEPNEGGYTFNPTHSGGWDYDGLYTRCKAEGMDVLACIKTIPPWMTATYPEGQRDPENVPLRYGKNFSDPHSYLEQAKAAFQYAARYGSNPNINSALLSVNSKQRWTGDGINVVKKGLNLIKYIECDNERDKWWKGRKGYQTGREYAANLSAFYDGHKNTMGPAVGVKNADPSMKIVIGGFASPFNGIDYLKGMIDWCKEFRGFKPDGSVNLCWDVINYHFYPDDASSTQSGNGTRGVAPEVSSAGTVADRFIQLAQQQSQDMPVWVSETGYDVNQRSPLKAIAIGNKSILQTQADWTLRNALLYARKGIERVYFYQTYDYDINNPTQFASSGLLNSNQTRKPAADFLYQTNKKFGQFTYKQTLQNNPIIDQYEYNDLSAYVLLVPDETGRTASATLNLGSAISAKIYKPTIGSDSMHVEVINIVQGPLTLTVSETPIFVVVASDQTMNTSTTLRATVYPNPSTDFVTIALENSSLEKLEIKVFSAGLGALFKEISFPKKNYVFKEKIDISALPEGIYIIEIKQKDHFFYQKIIKGH
jgi:hypothetical protein